jgi:hypothetical protein
MGAKIVAFVRLQGTSRPVVGLSVPSFPGSTLPWSHIYGMNFMTSHVRAVFGGFASPFSGSMGGTRKGFCHG